jgi:hypothetical protein
MPTGTVPDGFNWARNEVLAPLNGPGLARRLEGAAIRRRSRRKAGVCGLDDLDSELVLLVARAIAR